MQPTAEYRLLCNLKFVLSRVTQTNSLMMRLMRNYILVSYMWLQNVAIAPCLLRMPRIELHNTTAII